MQPPAQPPPSPPRPRTSPRLAALARLALWLALALATLAVALAGISMRHTTWDLTEPVRFHQDMKNAWFWGTRASQSGFPGFISLYDQVRSEHPDRAYSLDYGPLRLTVDTLWVVHQRSLGVKDWSNTWALNAPLLRLNALSDALASLALGLIVFLTAFQRPSASPLPLARRDSWRTLAAAAGALAGAALLWLNPAVHVSGFGRPTWDVWILPFYLAAALGMLRRQWFLAGVLLAIGAMFKGQQLAVLPFFLAWSLFTSGPRSLLSFLLGLATGAAVVLWPWLLSDPPAGPVAGIAFRHLRWDLITLLFATAALPFLLTLLLRRKAARWRPTWRLASTLSLLLTLALFWSLSLRPNASWSWYEIAFHYGTEKFPELEVGKTSSLAGILRQSYRWQTNDLVLNAARWHPAVTLKQLLITLYASGVIALGVAAGLGQRRGNLDRALIAIPAVWVLFFAIMPQMHERYLLWGAACCAVLVVRHVGLMLLIVPLSLLSWAMTLLVMLESGSREKFVLLGYTGRVWARWIDASYPAAGWMVVLAAGVLVWCAVWPGAGGSKRTRVGRVDSADARIEVKTEPA